MASEEQLNNQKEFNSSLEEAQEFIGLLVSRTSDLVDTFRRLNNRSKDVTRDQSETLKILKSINTSARNLTSEYSSMKDITNAIKEAKKNQIKLDNTILSLGQKISEDSKEKIKKYIEGQQEIISLEEKYKNLAGEAGQERIDKANELFSLEKDLIKNKENLSSLEEGINKSLFEDKKNKEIALAASRQQAYGEYQKAVEAGNKKQIAEAKKLYETQNTLYKGHMDSYTLSEKEYDIASKTVKEKQKEYDLQLDKSDGITKNLATSQKELSDRKDINNELYSELNLKDRQYVLAQKASEENKKTIQYLKEQEEKQNRINKSLGLFNLTIGAAGGLLEGLGLKGASIALGFEEGKKAAEEMARKIESGEEKAGMFGKNITVLGAGIKATFGSIAGGLKEALSFTALITGASKLFGGLVRNIASIVSKGLKGVFNVLISPAKQVVSEIGGLFSEGIDYIKNSFFSIRGFMDSFKEGENLMKELSTATKNIATDLGVSTKQAQGLTNQVSKFSGELGAFPEVLAANMVELNKAFGTTMEFSDATARSYNRLIQSAGFAAGEAAEFVKLSQLQGESVNDTLKGYEDEIMYQKAINNSAVSQKEVLQEIAKASSATRLTFRGQGKSLAEAAFQAKALGLEMSKLEDIGGSLLNFEDSIAKEMEAELLLGKDLNLERARQAALQNDSATLAKELAKNIGSAAEFGKKNVIQQEALAAAVGMTRDELAKTLETQELLAGTGLSDMNQAQEEYKKMLKETGDAEKAAAKFRQKYGNEALSQQVAKASYAEQDALRQRQLVATQMEMAKAMLPVAQAFRKVVQYVQDLRAILIDKMQPFFKAFGGLVNQGGKSFKEMAEGPVGKLGTKLNEIGLKLVEFFKTHGPEIKNIFSKIFDVFGAIYSKVAEIIGKVFEMGGGADKMASGAFGGMANILDKVIEKINGIDVEALIEDVKGFIQGVKDAFTFIKGMFDKIVSFAKDHPTLAKILGGGALTIGLGSKVAPELTNAILGAGGSLIKMAGAKTLDLAKGAGNFLSSKLGFGKIFGMTESDKENLGTSASNPMYVEVINAGDIGGGGGAANESLTDMLDSSDSSDGKKKKGRKPQARDSKGRFTRKAPGKAGRIGNLVSKVTSKVGNVASKAGSIASKATSKIGGLASKAGSILPKAGSLAGGIGKLAVGGGVGAVAGIAVEAAIGHFQKNAEKAAEALEKQIVATTDGTKAAELDEKKKQKLRQADNLAAAGTIAKYTAMGAGFGSAIPVVGTAVGAIAGFVVGTVKANSDLKKANEWRNSETYKAQEEYNRNLQRIQIAEEESQVLQDKLRLDAIKQAGIEEQAVKAKFAEAIAGTGKSFEDLKTMSIDPSSDAFRVLGNDMVNAGNITKEQFSAALKGAISPLELINIAAENAGSRLKELTEASIGAADALGKKLTDKLLEDSGVNKEAIEYQQKMIENFRESTKGLSEDLMAKYGGDLKRTFGDVTAADALSGKDKDSKAFMADIRKQLERTGAGPEEIEKAIKDAQAIFKNQNIDLDSTENIEKVMSTITNQLEQNLTAPLVEAQAKGAQATNQALKQIPTVKDIASKIDVKTLSSDKNLQSVLKDLNIGLKTDKKGNITNVNDIQTQLAKQMTELAGTDAAKFNELLKRLGGAPAPAPPIPATPPQAPGAPSPPPQAPGVPPAPPTPPPSQPTAQATQPAEIPKVGKALALGGMGIFGGLASLFSPKSQLQPTATQPAEAPKEGKVGKALALGGMGMFGASLASLFSSNKTQPAAAQPTQAPKEGSISKTPSILGGIGASLASLFSKAPDAKALAGKAAAPAGKAATPAAGAVGSANKMLTEALITLNKSIGSITPSFQSIPKLFNSFTTTLAKLFNSLILAFKTFTEIQVQLEASKDPENKMFADIFKNLKGVTGVKVKDGSTVSNKGPFTISDRFGNMAITHPQDKLVVSPNISYVNDGISSPSRNQVFPVSEGFGMLDVKVSPKGVMVQKINDGISDKEIDKTKQEIWDKYKGENRKVIPGKPGIYAWDSVNEKMFFINETAKSPSHITFANSEAFHNYTRVPERELIGVRSDMGFANPDKINLNTLKNLIYEAFGASEANPAGVGQKGNESTLDSILDPFQPDLIRQTIKGYAPVPPTKTTYFHTLPNKEGYRPPDLISMGQSASEGLSLEGAAVQQVQDAISPWEIFSNPIGAVKHYLLPVIVEESGHIIKSLFKSKTLLAPLKAILKKTPIIGHAMHATTGAINISHLLHKEGVTRDKLDQEVGKAALTTLGGIGGGILGTMLVGTLGTLATGPAGMVLSVLGGTVGGILGEMFAGFVADKLGARPVGSPIVSLFHQEHNKLHPPTSASPNLAHTAPKPKTSPQRVSDGSSSSKGPFTIADRFGNVAVTHPKDGIVVSPNISYVNDGVTGKKGPVFPVSEKFGALDVKVSPKGVMVQKVNDGVGSNLVSVSQSISENLSLEEAAMPKLAKGGMVSKPTVALIGEAGPEAVVPLDQIAQESPQTSTTVIESDNSDLKKELQEMKQLMAGLISQIPSIANRPITVELNGNKVGQALGQNAYRM